MNLSWIFPHSHRIFVPLLRPLCSLLALAEAKTNFWLLGQAKAEIYQRYHRDGPVNNNAKCQQKTTKPGRGSKNWEGRVLEIAEEQMKMPRKSKRANNGKNDSTGEKKCA